MSSSFFSLPRRCSHRHTADAPSPRGTNPKRPRPRVPPAVLPLAGTHRSGCLTTVRPLAISCASRECMGGGAAPYLRASPVPSRASRRGMVKRTCDLMGLEKRGGGGGRQGRPWRGGLVTEIIDRRQQAVMRAGMAGLASPGEHAPWSGEGLGAPRRQKASHRDQRQRADAMSRVRRHDRRGTRRPSRAGRCR